MMATAQAGVAPTASTAIVELIFSVVAVAEIGVVARTSHDLFVDAHPLTAPAALRV